MYKKGDLLEVTAITIPGIHVPVRQGSIACIQDLRKNGFELYIELGNGFSYWFMNHEIPFYFKPIAPFVLEMPDFASLYHEATVKPMLKCTCGIHAVDPSRQRHDTWCDLTTGKVSA